MRENIQTLPKPVSPVSPRHLANPDLWKILDLELGKRDIEWTWIRGHNGDPMNELADRLANEEAARVLQFVSPSANPITVGIN